MAQFFAIHPENPQERLVKQAAEIVRQGGVIVYPTDSCYALGCQMGNKEAMERILAIRQIDLRHHLTLMCADLSELGTYAKVDNSQFRQLKATTPGAYTFILPATKEVPNRTLHPTAAAENSHRLRFVGPRARPARAGRAGAQTAADAGAGALLSAIRLQDAGARAGKRKPGAKPRPSRCARPV